MKSMKTIGLIGGLSWESSRDYYRVINEEVASRLGGLHSAECVMTSLDFALLAQAMADGDW
jgi:aspartate racemase